MHIVKNLLKAGFFMSGQFIHMQNKIVSICISMIDEMQ
ncbi:hypothetical protein EAL2_c13730 [Peptoclostridium acidaminophilum DSM 3953]|uniref:Uncharacterized protein n=1 Tax=Peptoclostridium acidaminophilum DSM 3953 TaxID=1286171 RepID=W8TFS4_PEPAC|nr:hypothetical protein EAL2_c13730 [Peptoclostridium acidaminophilum DSM 3953]